MHLHLAICCQGWPRKGSSRPDIVPYWNACALVTVCGWLLMYGHRIVVPKSLQKETMQEIHAGHQGIDAEQELLHLCGGQE